jgi:hypothetical protein
MMAEPSVISFDLKEILLSLSAYTTFRNDYLARIALIVFLRCHSHGRPSLFQ